MGIVKAIKGRRVYLDSNIFIYGVEHHPVFSGVVKQIFESIDEGQFEAITSELTLAEVLVKPNERNLEKQKISYIDIITGNSSLSAIAVTQEILIQSAAMRAETGMKLPDAIHVTTSLDKACGVFLTNDSRIKTPENITHILLSDFCR